MIIQILGVILFVGLGIMFLKGKGGAILTYHNVADTPSKSEDENLLEKKICKYAAVVCFIIGVALVKYTVGNLSELTWLTNASVALLAGTVFVMLLSLFKGSLIEK